MCGRKRTKIYGTGYGESVVSKMQLSTLLLELFSKVYILNFHIISGEISQGLLIWLPFFNNVTIFLNLKGEGPVILESMTSGMTRPFC